MSRHHCDICQQFFESRQVFVCCPECLEIIERDVSLAPEEDCLLAIMEGMQKEMEECGQVLGKALDCPAYPDENSAWVCTGDHTPGTLAQAAAKEIKRLRAREAELLEKLQMHKEAIKAMSETIVMGDKIIRAFHSALVDGLVKGAREYGSTAKCFDELTEYCTRALVMFETDVARATNVLNKQL